MAKRLAELRPSTAELLRQLGHRLRLARLRRRLPAKQLAERAGMVPLTLRSLERGGSAVTMGAYLAVMQVLGIEKDLDLLGKADPVGRELPDAELPSHARTTRPIAPLSTNRPLTGRGPPRDAGTAPMPRVAIDGGLPEAKMRKARAAMPRVQLSQAAERVDAFNSHIQNLVLQPAKDERDWIEKSGFASAEGFACLIEPLSPKKKRR